MQNYVNSAAYDNGYVIPNATVSVYLTGTTTLATLYSSNSLSGGTKTNPLTTDSNGSYSFYAPNGLYDISITNPQGLTITLYAQALSDPTQVPYIWALSQGVKSDGATNDTAALQAIINTLAAQGGGVISLAPGTNTKAEGIVLKSGVFLNTGAAGNGYQTAAVATITGINGTLPIIDTPSSLITSGGVQGINFNGVSGAGGLNIGVRLQNASRTVVKQCAFSGFNDQAVLAVAGIAPVLEDIIVINSLLNRSRSQANGTVELQGGCTDAFLSRIEANASQSTLSSASLYVNGILIAGTNCMISSCVGEGADQGIVVTGAYNRFSNCRGDTNFGHGITNGGTHNMFASCLAYNNSASGSAAYSGFNTLAAAGDAAYAACVSDGPNHQYAFLDSINTGVNQGRSQYAACKGYQYATAEFSGVGFEGSGFTTASSVQQAASLTTIPDTTNSNVIRFVDAAANTVTNFKGGWNGKVIYLRATTANTTIANNGTIVTSTGANVSLATGKIYTFIYDNGVWYEAAGG